MLITPPLRGAELLAAENPCVPWMWEGLLADGNITLLTGMWKAGKTTLLSMLLSQRDEGGELLRRVVRAGSTAVVSEEPADLWRRRARQFGFGTNLSLYCRPFAGVPDTPGWEGLLHQLARERDEHGIDLAVFDPLLHFLPCAETDSTALRRLLPTLRVLTERGMAVLLMHHPAKDDGGLGKAARGSAVLSMVADIVLELRAPPGDALSRRRQLCGFSRHAETPRQLLIELKRSGNDYELVADRDVQDDFGTAWSLIVAILVLAERPPTRPEILAQWPTERGVPHEATLWRWLQRAVGLGLVEREGKGTKNEPYRFRLRMGEEGEVAGEAPAA